LREWGIRYVLIETKGGAVREERDLKELLNSEFASYRKLGDYAIYFRQSLMALAERSRFRHFDGRMLLFELEPATFDVDILDSQQQAAAHCARHGGIQQGGIGMAEVKIAVGRGRETENAVGKGPGHIV
jgi:hypothetical protein